MIKIQSQELSIWILQFLLIFILRFVFGEHHSVQFGEIIYLISISILLFILFLLARKKYNNMSSFFFLSFLLLGLLPYFHYLHYTCNRKNYTFNAEYLHQNILGYRQELTKFSDSIPITELQSKFKKTSFNIIVNDSVFNRKQRIYEYTFIVKNMNNKSHLSVTSKRPNDRGRIVTEIYKNDFFLTTIEIQSGNLKNEINRYFAAKKLVNRKIQYPELFVPFNDIWLDSVTGFIFSFIKPLSKTSQLIRLVQLITAYFLFHMISSWLKLSQKLNVTEKDK